MPFDGLIHYSELRIHVLIVTMGVGGFEGLMQPETAIIWRCSTPFGVVKFTHRSHCQLWARLRSLSSARHSGPQAVQFTLITTTRFNLI